MKQSFSARRVPRKVGREEDEGAASTEGEVSGTFAPQTECNRFGLTTNGRASLLTCGTEPTLQRPTFKPRKGTTLRKSFGPTAVEDEDGEEAVGVVTPKRQGLSRTASQRNAAKKSAIFPSSLPTRQDDDDDRPSYSAASLQELKNSTPTTPRDLATDASASEVEDVEKSTQALDLSSKFGNSLSRYHQSSAIPSAAEIEEKKARRARLAKEQAADEFMSLDPDDPQLDDDEEDPNVMRDENGRLVLKPKDKYGQAESRLVHDDEDIMENFDEFTEADGKILLGRKAEAEAARRRKQEMAAQIADAEGSSSDSDSNASEKERNEAFEAAQTRHGTYAEKTTSTDPYASIRPRTPPNISPLPTLDGVLERLRAQVLEMQTERMRRMKEMEDLQKEKVRLGQEEVRIQRQLKETGEWYAKLRAEKGLEGEAGKGQRLIEDGEELPRGAGGEGMVGAGLGFAAGGGSSAGAGIGFGAASGAGLGFGTNVSNTDTEDNVDTGRSGLGMGTATSMAGRGLESLGASTAGTPDADMDSDT